MPGVKATQSTKPAASPEAKLALEATFAKLNKELGAGTIVRGDEIRVLKKARISSGALPIDVALGGGWTVNSWHEIIGHECLMPGTRILTTDLRWVNIENLSVGDEIVGFDEETSHGVQGKTSCYRRANITHLGSKMLPVYEVVTPHGKTYASEGHLWLTHRMTPRASSPDGKRSQQRQWVRTDSLRPGNKIACLGPMWETDTSWEAGYLAGFYDGEGYLSDRLGCAQVIGPTADRALQYLEKLGYSPNISSPYKGKEHWQEQIRWTLRGRYEEMRFLGSVRPERLLQKGVNLWEGRSTKSVHSSTTQVLEVNFVGVRKVITIETTTKTLVANGMLSHNSSGKTLLILKTVAANQEVDPNYRVFWVASEDFDMVWAQQVGCDLKRFTFMFDNGMKTVYTTLLEVMTSREYDCVVVDSFPALVPEEEEEAEMSEWQVGLGARINSKFFRKQRPALSRSLVEEQRAITCFMVNQWRQKIGLVFGDPRTTPGGTQKNFEFITRTEMSRDEWIKEDKEKVGVVLKAHTIKNKSAAPERVAVVDFYFSANDLKIPVGEFDNVKALIAVGRLYGVIELAGNTYSYGGQKWVGQGKLAAGLREDLGLQSQLRDEIMAEVERKATGVIEPVETPPNPGRRRLKRTGT